MIGNLARKRMNVVALAVLAALMVALFAVMGTSRAAAGDITIPDTGETAAVNATGNKGYCVAVVYTDDVDTEDVNEAFTGTVVTNTTSSPAAESVFRYEDADGVDQFIQCPTEWDGRIVTVEAIPESEPLVQLAPSGLTVTALDSDGSVEAGSNVTITFTYNNNYSAFGAAEPTLVRRQTSRGYDLYTIATDDAAALYDSGRGDGTATGAANSAVTIDEMIPMGATENALNRSWSVSRSVEVPEGVPAGPLTISAKTSAFNHDMVDFVAATDDAAASGTENVAFDGSVTLDIVEDAGDGLASAALSLVTKADDVTTTADESAPGKSAVPAGDTITVSYQALNELGEKSNNDDVKSITVLSTGGATVAIGTESGVGNVTETDVDASGAFTITKDKAGAVDVYVILTGDGSATSDPISLSFTGAAGALTLGDGVNIEAGNSTDVAITAQDASGTDVALPTIRTAVTDADGKATSTITAKKAKNDDDEDVVRVSADAKAVAGDYTVTVSIVGSEVEGTASVTIVGVTDTLELEASAMSSDTIGDVVTLTATLTDENGNTVENKTTVTFTASPAMVLSTIGGSHADVESKDGVASVSYVVTGAGTAVLSAVADGVSNVVVFSSTAGEGAAADEAVSLACLSATNGFATYTCGVDSSASELFGLVSGRGATAVHLWNGSDWVRYSVVDGAMVPGSSDFTVTDNDILYISN